jgi:signal transduction histidine kinase/phage shock protein PspC (stress-responsive transcriptional regulator)
MSVSIFVEACVWSHGSGMDRASASGRLGTIGYDPLATLNSHPERRRPDSGFAPDDSPAAVRDDRSTMPTVSLTFPRRSEHRVLAGVAGGFADEFGVDPFVVRAALVVLSLTGGLGVVIYALGFVLSSPAALLTPGVESHHGTDAPNDLRRTVAVGSISLGVVLIVRSTGLWLGDAVMVPLLVVVAGLAVLATRGEGSARGAWGAVPTEQLVALGAGRWARARIGAGIALVALGLLLVGAGRDVSSGVRIGAFATALTIVGVALVLGPWLARAARDVAEERRQRIRSDERAAMAAHLHDSVLQTLALIQRNAGDPRRTVTLARQQERELRTWLYGATEVDSTTLAASVAAITAEVESLYDLPIDDVVVGDAPMDAALTALVGALREACVNAAKHSGATEVSVFVEVDPAGVDAYVRDRGRGFDPAAVAEDRKGIAESIVLRLARHGGTARVDTTMDVGTEVHLHLPRRDTPTTGDEA